MAKSTIRKLINISNQTVIVDTKQYGTVYLAPRAFIENVSVRNLKEIKSFVKVIVNLNE